MSACVNETSSAPSLTVSDGLDSAIALRNLPQYAPPSSSPSGHMITGLSHQRAEALSGSGGKRLRGRLSASDDICTRSWACLWIKIQTLGGGWPDAKFGCGGLHTAHYRDRLAFAEITSQRHTVPSRLWATCKCPGYTRSSTAFVQTFGGCPPHLSGKGDR